MIKLVSILLVLNCTTSYSKDVEKDLKSNYQQFLDKCNRDSCCERSVKVAESIKAIIISRSTECPKGYQRDLLKCKSSYVWCKQNMKAKPRK